MRTIWILAIIGSGCGAGPRDTAPPAKQPGATEPVAPTQLSAADRQRDAARTPLAQAAVDAFANVVDSGHGFIARWSPDGARVVFGSLRDGVPEIYVGDPAAPAAAPRALTVGPERALAAQYTPDGRAVVFLRDTGGDENHAIWRVDADGAHPTNLTPGEPMHRSEPLIPARRGEIMLYSAARTSAPDTMVFRQRLAGGAPEQIYAQRVPGQLVDVTADGTRALFAEFRGNVDIIVREIDVESGRAHQVYPPPGTTAGLYGIAYAADGARVLLSTDRADAVILLELDAATGRELGSYRDAVPSSPLAIAASPAGDVLAVGLDAGTHGVVRILDARTFEVRRTVAAPLGEIALGAFRRDGKAFSISIGRPDHPPDPYAVDVATGAVTPLRADVRPGLATLPALDVSVHRAKAFDGLEIPINVYLPGLPAAPTMTKLPVIVSFHGGPSSSSPVRWSPSIRFFTALGYAVVEPNVRGSTGFGRAYEMADNREKRADWLRDLETVNTWIKAQPWCDPARVVIMGGSYGGYTVLMALTRQPTRWRAGIDVSGVADLRQFLLTTDARIRSGFVPEFGDVDRDAALLEQFSPMRDVDRIVAPLFVYAGQNDPRVPRGDSDAIVRALRRRKIPVEYMVTANEGHSLDHRETKIELFVRAARFVEDALR